MDAVAYIVFGGVGLGILFFVVDKCYLAWQSPKEKRRYVHEHDGYVRSKKFYPGHEIKNPVYYGMIDIGMGAVPVQESTEYVDPRYEVELVIDQEYKKVFNDERLFNSCDIGDSVVLSIEDVVESRKSFLEEHEQRKSSIKNFRKEQIRP